jgi:DNA repair exonuclease SbcCD nuclease subunit
MIHTTIKDVVGTIPMDSVEKEKLPLANYYAMGHIHQRFEIREKNAVFVYPGPIFPNNFQELVDLECGSFCIANMEGSDIKVESVKIPLKEVVSLNIEIDNGLTATEKIISEIDRHNLRDKIVLLKLKGILSQGKTGDIRFNEIEEFVKKKEAYSFLRNISSVKVRDAEMVVSLDDGEKIEEKIFTEYSDKNPGEYNKFLTPLMNALSIEKNEDEKGVIFENRLMDDLNKILKLGETE